jgi:aminodeoxyfutalosine deaminase
MLDHGVVVTLNTDDPPMFGATLTGEYVAVAERWA